MSDSLRPHESQDARPPCPSPTPGVHSDSRPWSRWCHPVISSYVVPFSSYPQSRPASESFPMSQLFTWGGQSTGVSALASFLPKKSQGWSPLEWTGWISLKSKGLSRVFSNTTVQKHQYKSFAQEDWQWLSKQTRCSLLLSSQGFPGGSVGKESACNAGDTSLIPESGRSPGEGNGNPLQYSCLRNPMDRGGWWVTVHGVTRVGHNFTTKPSWTP